MGKIRILSAEEIKKIAAGEVVERPANIVKELLENALDAGATTLDIYIKDGGKSLVRVVDNGCGMSAEDVRQAFEQHATSKITSVNDLEHLQTFGFRGEALSSIASVSTVMVQTKEESASSGFALTVRYAQLEKIEEVACATGTDIAVHDIFSNIPARKKFLKTTETEWRQIFLLFQAAVLAHKECHFKLFHDGSLVHNCPPVADLASRVTQLWKSEVANHMIHVSADDNSMNFSIDGLVSNHQYMRYNTAQIFLFVNNRWIKNHSIIKALIRGYSGVFPHGKYPAGCLFMTIDPSLIDVNIHPRKEEVQFIHERKVEQLIQHAAKRALEEYVRSKLNSAHDMANIQPSMRSSYTSYQPVSPLSSSFSCPYTPSFPTVSSGRGLSSTSFSKAEVAPAMQEELDVPRYHLIGQYSKTYILLEKDDGLVMIDQHAAHERVLYELFSKRFHDVATVTLMFPHAVELGADDLVLVEKYLDMLKDHGVIADCMGENRLVVKSVPVYLKNADLSEFIHELLAELRERKTLDKEILFKQMNEKIHAQMACKAAVKAGDELSEEKMHEIIMQLEKTENKMTCPHGRPTIWFLSLSDIEKRFRRDYIR